MRVLVVSNMYPSRSNSQYGLFVKRLHLEIAQNAQVNFLYSVNTIANKGPILSFTKYASLFIKTILLSVFHRKKISLIHVHYGYPTLFFGMLAHYISRSPMIVTLHGSDVENFLVKNSFHKRLFAAMLRKVEVINPVSHSLAKKVNAVLGSSADKIFVQNMGIDLSIFSKKEKKEYTWNRFVYVGNLVQAKNPLFFIQFIEKLHAINRDVRADVIGDGPLFTECRNFIQSHGLQDTIRLHGRLPQNEIATIFGRIDFIVVPSLQESFGLVAAEAMASGIVPFVSNVGGLMEVVDDKKNGFHFDSNSQDSLTQTYSMFQSSNDYDKIHIVENGLGKARQYDWKTVASSFFNEYKTIAR